MSRFERDVPGSSPGRATGFRKPNCHFGKGVLLRVGQLACRVARMREGKE